MFIRVLSQTHTLTFKHRADPPYPQAPLAGKLTEGQLEEEEGDATEHQHDEVW